MMQQLTAEDTLGMQNTEHQCGPFTQEPWPVHTFLGGCDKHTI